MNMKELKTLKDMEHYNSWEGFKGHIEERELKAEAVKWLDSERIKHMNGIDILLVFCDITEDDLK